MAALPFAQSWYYLCQSRELSGTKPRLAKVGAREWVVFRGADGRAVALDPRCPHMGTDLSTGKVCEGRIHCPLHDWSYDDQGRCVAIPGTSEVPSFAKLRAYPVEERFGQVYVFSGREALFPLPFFDGEDPSAFRAAQPIRLVGESPWDVVSANAFDVTHFETFHGRKIRKGPFIGHPHANACRIEHEFEIVQPSRADRLLMMAGGKIGQFQYTSWNGSFILLKVGFKKIENFLQILFYPLPSQDCGIEIFVLQRKSASPLRLPLALKRLMTDQFFRREAEGLRHVHFNPATLLPTDAPLRDYMEWLGRTVLAPSERLSRSPPTPSA